MTSQSENIVVVWLFIKEYSIVSWAVYDETPIIRIHFYAYIRFLLNTFSIKMKNCVNTGVLKAATQVQCKFFWRLLRVLLHQNQLILQVEQRTIIESVAQIPVKAKEITNKRRTIHDVLELDIKINFSNFHKKLVWPPCLLSQHNLKQILYDRNSEIAAFHTCFH